MDIQKHISKTWLKTSGKVHKIINNDQYGWVIVIYKGTGQKKRFIAFSISRFTLSNNDDIRTKFESLVEGSRVKLRFTPMSSESKGRWYTNLLIQDIQDWKVNEEKLKREQALKKQIDENEYKNSLFN